jgi:hypothetical protein
MTWEYGEAIDGNVALLGELPATQGTLAIGFSDSGFCARYNNREDFRAMRKASPWPVASDEKGHCRLHGGASGSVALLANGVGNTVTADQGAIARIAEDAPRWPDRAGVKARSWRGIVAFTSGSWRS